MKKILLTLLSIGSLSFFVQAQKWVATTPQNKNVILEEFTGIHCGYCPDGHKIANNLVNANQGRMFLINIHSGSFAVPATGEPDFRTTAGTAIDGSSGITGYPSGTLNRSTSPWGQNRNLWSATATSQLSQASPLNVAVKSSVDVAKRELTTEVEVYYTSDAAQATNYLTIALTESDILGPQSDYGNYNPTNWVNGKYRHNHVLRQLITAGNFGELISTTTKGTYFYKKFVTTIPAKYINVDAVLFKMDVVAFVSATSNGANIISGAGAPVDFDPNLKTDLSVTDLTAKPTNLCNTTISPKVDVTNNLDQVVTTFDVSAIVSGTTYKKTFNGSLAKGQKTTIDWGSIPFTPGAYSVNIQGFSNVNSGLLFDVDNINDATSFSGIGLKTKAFTSYKDGFETGLPANSALDISENPKVQIAPNTTVKYGNFGTKYALLFYLHSSWNVAGKPGHWLFGEADLSAYTDPAISYYYAYSDGLYGGTAPTIGVSISEDCGATWKTVNTVTAKETGQPTTSGNLYDPKSGEYVYVIVPLTAYAGKNVIVRLTGTPGTHGNALYIDEVRINSAKSLSVAKLPILNTGVVFTPNPVSNQAQIDFELLKPSEIVFTVYNLLNQAVYTKKLDNQNIGNHSESFDFSSLNPGVYSLELRTDDAITTKKFIKN